MYGGRRGPRCRHGCGRSIPSLQLDAAGPNVTGSSSHAASSAARSAGSGSGSSSSAGDGLGRRLRRRDRNERAEHRLIGRLALAQPFGKRRRGCARSDRASRALRRSGWVDKILEEQRQEVGQLGGADEQAVLLVQRLQIDHRLAAVAALAVHMLEQMQRQRAGAVEQQHVALLQVVEIAGGDIVDQGVELPAHRGRNQILVANHRAQLVCGALQLRVG